MTDTYHPDALRLLQQRVSSPKLTKPAPTPEQLDELFTAALRAPDHGGLRPWRFILLEDDDRKEFATILYGVKLAEGASDELLAKALKMPLRAPTIVIAVSSPVGERISLTDQRYSAVAATQNMVLAAEALDIGAIWRTGWPAENRAVAERLGLSADESIVGIVYLGARDMPRRNFEKLHVTDFVSRLQVQE